MEIDTDAWVGKITKPYDSQAELIKIQDKYLVAMTERLEEMQFMLEGKGTNSVLSEDYLYVLREHIELALEGVRFGEEGKHRNEK
jgi:hypothetical protein